ncbi:GNAT family N-acetyltransferase [Phenylobacterium sp. NIBR 498073]|uniref:GNAT family N-acetyltransferase n=1 Tax=Phenylobacterium sp. NIBR 498073 TaxID=3015177 RepID=UPI0022B4FFB6|nr:GNAT family N-acetyltransferase [Phenylobacterium sp. NIBR 498073]MBS0492185.1 N-acetyltransferase [Pseudomonadota bacterium]WGU41636.1 GNAT family N-acetyltransferase [Phenylobacterium sp. NIBR 498073]
MSSELRDNKVEQRFEMTEQGMTSWADYRLAGDRLFIDHVESPVPLRGTGASGRLMAALAADARARGLKIVPICGFAAAWLRRSHEFRGLLA